MVSPYVYFPTNITMILPDNVTHPKSLTLYLEDYGFLYLHLLGPSYFDFRFFEYRQYERNATLGFNFVVNWENVENFNLDIRVSDENKQFIDLSGIPQSVNYTIGNDELFNLDPGTIESGGIKISSVKSFAIIAFIMIFITFLI